jgi:hypothetical protein
MRIRTAIIGLGVGALALTGCGGTSDSETASTETTVEETVEDSSSVEETVEDSSSVEEEPVEEAPTEGATQEAEADIPYFYGYGCEGAAETLLDMATYFAEFDPTAASSDDAATFRAMGEAMIATANLPEEGAAGEGVTLADQAIYATGISAIDLADIIDNAGFTREIEDQTGIFGEDATRAVQECGLE